MRYLFAFLLVVISMSDYGQSPSLYNGIEDYEKDVYREVVADFNIALSEDTCELKGTFS